MSKNGFLPILPYISVGLYMCGLFLLVLGYTAPGLFCVITGTVAGITAGIILARKKYKPSRQITPKWLQFFGVKDKP